MKPAQINVNFFDSMFTRLHRAECMLLAKDHLLSV